MAIAVNHNRIAMVFLIDKQPMDWELSYVGASSPDQAHTKVTQWITHYGVDVVVTESCEVTTRKGKRTMRLMLGVREGAIQSPAQHIEVIRHQPFQSKYEQIDDLVQRYPQMQAVAPKKRRYWENESHAVTIFEALAMTEQVTRE